MIKAKIFNNFSFDGNKQKTKYDFNKIIKIKGSVNLSIHL